ncbi:MAG: IS1 family transposase [Alphaproteobacteria bacterium]
MNRLSIGCRTQAVTCLVEGNSIRSTERMTGIHRDTICRLLVEVGQGCAKIMDDKMRDLRCQRIQVDELWGYVGKKQARLRPGDDRQRLGDQWTFVALDPDTKLVPAYRVGKRTRENAVAFMMDLSGRVANRVQISSDSLNTYIDAVERAFGADVDYGQIVKFYDVEPIGPGRYAPPRVTGAARTVIAGSPDHRHISTSLVERQNLTMRMQMRRFTRLTNAFSKKIENLRAAVSLHFAHYNFVRTHRSLRVTPAMAAGVSDRLWTLQELVERADG